MSEQQKQGSAKDDQAYSGQVEPLVMLKPCPHCGGNNFTGPHYIDYVGDSFSPSWWIECNQCPCGMEVDGEDINNLIAAWNRRAV